MRKYLDELGKLRSLLESLEVGLRELEKNV
jgi:hypothetical protein